MPDLTTLPPIITDRLLPSLAIIAVGLVAMRLVRIFVHGVVQTIMDREATEGTAQDLSAVERKKRMDTVETMGSRVIQAFVVIIATLMVLDEFDYDIGPAVAGLGVVGIAVGFGAQSLVRDYFNGALILLENQFSIGDVVSIAGVTGSVEDFSLRRTTLRDLDGVVHTVPNGEIKVTSNRTRTWARINEDVSVAYDTDMDRVVAIVEELGRQLLDDPAWKDRVLEAPHVERVQALGEYGVTLKILGTVRAVDQWAAGGEFRRRLLRAFAEHGIEIPFPHRVILNRAAGQPDQSADQATVPAADPPSARGTE